MIAALITMFVIGLVALIVISIVLSLVGVVFGLAFTLMFKVLPIVLVGYVMLRLLSRPKNRLPVEY